MINKERLQELKLVPRWPLTAEQMASLEEYHPQQELNTVGGLIDLVEDVAGQIAIENAAEVGCFRGVSTEVLAMYCQNLYAIDPWLDSEDIHNEFCDRMEPYENVFTIRLSSPAVCEMFQFGQFDFVYLDGMHTYNEVVADIKAWKPLVRSGGFLCGHDYVDYKDSWAAQWIQVCAAVNDTIGKPHKVFADSSWLWRKP